MSGIYTIAEIGINHNGCVESATRLIDLASDAGASAVKFQYRNSQRCYLSTTEIGDEILFTEILRTSLPPEAYCQLITYAKSLGLDVGLSFFLDEDIRDFDNRDLINVDFFKVPSPEFSNRILVDQLLKYNKHVICSTGAQSQESVDRFISNYLAKSQQISLMHCVSNYPLEPANSKLGYIKYLSRLWPGRVGYSSHDTEYLLCAVAVALGAVIIERHITLDKQSSGLDHSSSSSVAEFKHLVGLLHAAGQSLAGDCERTVNQGEVINLQNLGRSYYTAKTLHAGTRISKDDLIYRSPRISISSDTIDLYLDKPLLRDAPSAAPLTESYFDNRVKLDVDHQRLLAAKYRSKILVPARLHDLNSLRHSLDHQNYELHLSYGESLGEISVDHFHGNEQYSIHIPDYISSTSLIDPFSRDRSVKEVSQRIIDNLISLAHKISDLTGHHVPIVGSFSVHYNTQEFFKNIKKLCEEYSSPHFSICIQILPPFAWYFGGSCRTNVFDSIDSFKIIDKLGIPVCLDLSHLIMSSNYYSFDLSEAYQILFPHISHQHIAGAIGYDGEGTPLSTLNDSENSILSSMLSNPVYSVIEVWQGHLNNFAGFVRELNYLLNR